MEIKISGFGDYNIHNVVFDLNGTLMIDGKISENVEDRIKQLSNLLNVLIASSDIHGNLQDIATELGVKFCRLNPGTTAQQKLEIIQNLGADSTIAIGNGSNDVSMLKAAAIGIAIVGREGGSSKAIDAADFVCSDICDAIDCIINPTRIIATLRD